MEECAGDILRFMYQHKITTATLGGHGYGGKVALAFGCYHAERTTGVFNIDSAPLDHRYHDSFKELRSYIIRLKDLDLENFS